MSNGLDGMLNVPTDSCDGRREAFIKESQQNREKCRELSNQMAERVAVNGSVLKTFLDVQSRFDRYTPNNVLLITAQKADAKKLGEYKYWRQKGIWIKKDELKNPILILEPGKEYVKKDGSHGRYYNAKKLYDISQTEVKKQEELVQNVDEKILIKALLNNPPVSIIPTEADQIPNGKGAVFVPADQKIYAKRGMTVDDLFRSLVPELIYAEYAKDYREPEKFQCEKYAFQVYCATYMLCSKYGINTKDFSFEYGPEHFNGMDVKKVKYELFKMKDSMEKVSVKVDKVLHVERVEQEKHLAGQECKGRKAAER